MLPTTCQETPFPHLFLLKVYPSLKANTRAVFPRKHPFLQAEAVFPALLFPRCNIARGMSSGALELGCRGLSVGPVI